MEKWPSPILRRWLGLPVVGTLCLLVGLVFSITLQDRFMLALSIAAFIACAVKAAFFYRLIAHGEYDAVEGVCLENKALPMRKRRKVKLLLSSDQIQVLTLGQDIRLQVGHAYRFYLRKAKNADAGSLEYRQEDELLGYEEIDLPREEIGQEEAPEHEEIVRWNKTPAPLHDIILIDREMFSFIQVKIT